MSNTSVQLVWRESMKQLTTTLMNSDQANQNMVAPMHRDHWAIFLAQWSKYTTLTRCEYNRPVKCRHFVVGFEGNRFSMGTIHQQLMLALQLWNHIVLSLKHSKQKCHRLKTNKPKTKSYYWRSTCYEQFENSSRLDVLNDRDPDQHICIVQSDRLISKFVMGPGCSLFTWTRGRLQETFCS